MISPHILVLSAVLSILWGWHCFDEAKDYRLLRVNPTRTKAQMGQGFRSLICAICLESVCLAYVFRTSCVLLGLGDVVAAQAAFFTIIGVNVPGALFTVVSRKLD